MTTGMLSVSSSLLCMIRMFSVMIFSVYLLLLSGDQTLLRLPPATETPLSPHCFAPAASLHAGWAQAQNLHLLAQHRQTDALQEVKQEKSQSKRRAVGRRNREKSSLLMPEQTIFNYSSFLASRNIALIDLLICCIDEDDYDEEIIFWKHFISWLTIRLESGLLETLSQTGRADSCLNYYFYTFNQALIGTNTTTVLLQVSKGLQTVLPLWRR